MSEYGGSISRGYLPHIIGFWKIPLSFHDEVLCHWQKSQSFFWNSTWFYAKCICKNLGYRFGRSQSKFRSPMNLPTADGYKFYILESTAYLGLLYPCPYCDLLVGEFFHNNAIIHNSLSGIFEWLSSNYTYNLFYILIIPAIWPVWTAYFSTSSWVVDDRQCMYVVLVLCVCACEYTLL